MDENHFVRNNSTDDKEENPVIDAHAETPASLLQIEIKDALDEGLRKAIDELPEQQRTEIKQMAKEHMQLVREAAEKEKKAIWKRVEEIKRQTIPTFGNQ